MELIDWVLTIGAVVLVFGIALYTKRYVKSVADFIAGGRAAGRYIICNAQGEAASGVSNTVSKFQTLMTMGFVMQWWDTTPILILVALSGWVVYRYRQTRAMTIGQFFEMRYSRSFRLFAGVLGFISGLLNYGIFPAVSATFFVYFMGLPTRVPVVAPPYKVPQQTTLVAVDGCAGENKDDRALLAKSLMYQLADYNVGSLMEKPAVVNAKGADSDNAAIAKIGAAKKADQVMYVHIGSASLSSVYGGSSIQGIMNARARLVETSTGKTLWPTDNADGVDLQATGVWAGKVGTDAALKLDPVLTDNMATAISQPFKPIFAIPTATIVMAVYLIGSLWMMIVGGQVTLLIVDCIEGLLSHMIYVVVVLAILYVLPWGVMKKQLMAIDAPPQPQGYSMVNPFNQSKTKDFNFSFQMMMLLTTVYGYMTVQKDNTFTSAARTPHESRMGRVLGSWRTYSRTVMLVVVSIAAFAYMKDPHFPGAALLHSLKGQTADQMRVPIALRYLLPVGIKGLFCAMMILSLTAGDGAHILTWGGVFVQDVLLPFRGDRPLTQKQHVFALRLAISFVALFAFCFSQVFTQTQYVQMWWDVTEAIFAGGAGAAIIGGLYWKRGTTAGAWSAVIVGSSLAFIGIIVPWWKDTFPGSVNAFIAMSPHIHTITLDDKSTMGLIEYAIKNFPNGRQVKFGAELAAIVVYFVVSLATCRQPHNMDKLLNRGKYAVADDQAAETKTKAPKSWIARLLEFSDDFTFWDKVIAGGVFFWSMFWLGIVLTGSVWNLSKGHMWSSETWATYWFVAGIVLPLFIGVFTLIWFTIGGTHDIVFFFRRLATMRRDTGDDGTVQHKIGADMPPAPKSAA